jgi:hypothetical protein
LSIAVQRNSHLAPVLSLILRNYSKQRSEGGRDIERRKESEIGRNVGRKMQKERSKKQKENTCNRRKNKQRTFVGTVLGENLLERF